MISIIEQYEGEEDHSFLYGILQFLLISAFIVGVWNALSPIFDGSKWNSFLYIPGIIVAMITSFIYGLAQYCRLDPQVGEDDGDKEIRFNFGISTLCLTALLVLNLTDPIMDIAPMILLKAFLTFGCYVGMAGMCFSDTFKTKDKKCIW